MTSSLRSTVFTSDDARIEIFRAGDGSLEAVVIYAGSGVGVLRLPLAPARDDDFGADTVPSSVSSR